MMNTAIIAENIYRIPGMMISSVRCADINVPTIVAICMENVSIVDFNVRIQEHPTMAAALTVLAEISVSYTKNTLSLIFRIIRYCAETVIIKRIISIH